MINKLHQLFEKGLREIYFIEKNMVGVLKTMSKNSTEKEIKDVFKTHCRETQEQIRRIERIFFVLGRSPRQKTSFPMQGLRSEGKHFMKEKPTNGILDFFYLGEAMKTERLEISAYEFLIALARGLELVDAVNLLQRSIKEEERALRKIESLAYNYNLSPLKEGEGVEV
jgi:ferritin-like metal-binding protein YciE